MFKLPTATYNRDPHFQPTVKDRRYAPMISPTKAKAGPQKKQLRGGYNLLIHKNFSVDTSRH